MPEKGKSKRKFNWGEDAKRNTSRLVAALLFLAEEQLEPEDSHRNQAVQAGWTSSTKLQVTGNESNGKRKEGTTLPALVQLVEMSNDSVEPMKAKSDASSGSKEERQAEAVRNVINCLKDLGVLEDGRQAQNIRYWKFTLILKSEVATKEENLNEVNQKWDKHKQQSSLETSQVTSATDESISWQNVCQSMLEKQREKQIFRRSITGRELGHEARAVYVKLGLVKPKEQPRRGEDFKPSAAQGMLQYRLTEEEVEQEYKHDEFLQQVIESKKKNFAIIGEPGAGKSTWLEQIALYVNHSETPQGFPICISLASLGRKNLEDYLLQNWLEDALSSMPSGAGKVTPILEREFKELFNLGKVWLLLDGLDEMVRTRESLLQTIADQLRGWVDKARVVLTCRLNIWEANPNALPNFDTYRTLHFDDKEVGQFIQQWFTEEGKPELGKQLKDKLGESGRERIQDLVKNPLRLSMLCKIWYLRRGDLPKTKAILYQRFIDDFYQWTPHRLLTNNPNKQKALHTALSKLALKAIEKGLPLREKFAHEIMDECLFQLARDVGWLNPVYRDTEADRPVYAFFHLTFQEYFAAQAVEDWHFFLNHNNENPNPLLDSDPSLQHNNGKPAYRIFCPQWREVFLLWMGLTNVPIEHKKQFIQALVKFKDGCGEWIAFEGVKRGFYDHRAYFLAAAGISEFDIDTFSLIEEIVLQLIEWSLGNSEKQQKKAIKLIRDEAKAALPKTNRTCAIKQLLQFIQSNRNHFIQKEAFELLGEIAIGSLMTITELSRSIELNEERESHSNAINTLGKIAAFNLVAKEALLQIIELTKNECACIQNPEYIRIQAAGSLVKIFPDEQKAIEVLVEFISFPSDEFTQFEAIKSLGNISTDNPTAIIALVELINSTDNEYIRFQAACSLAEIDPKHPNVIPELVKFIEPTEDELIRRRNCEEIQRSGNFNLGNTIYLQFNEPIKEEKARARVFKILEKIALVNVKVVPILAEIIESTKDKYTCRMAVQILGKISTGNSTAINMLENIVESTDYDEYSRIEAAKSLGKNKLDNYIAITKILDFIVSSEDEHIRIFAADKLGEIGLSNPSKAIKALEKAIELTQDEFSRVRLIYSLWKIKSDYFKITPALEKIIINSNLTEQIHIFTVNKLGEINRGNLTVLSALLQLIKSSENDNIRRQAVHSLKKILQDERLAKTVVTELKSYLSNESYKNDGKRFDACYEVVWHCAQIMTYRAFYQAWHHAQLTNHSGVTETTRIAFGSSLQQRDLAELPKLLRTAIDSDTELRCIVQLICIDGSKFIITDTPALEIYDTILDRGYPERQSGEPETMQALKVYWNSLRRKSDKCLVLVFHENPAAPAQQGFSEVFLKALSKFDGAICVVTGEIVDSIPIKQFWNGQPQLVENVVRWIRAITLNT